MKMIKEKLVLKRKVKIFLSKTLISIIILLIGLILIKKNSNLKKVIKENIYEKSIHYMNMKKNYEKYFGNLLSINKTDKTIPVSTEKIAYKKETKYKDGVELTVSKNTLVKALESGVVIYIGKKDDYNEVIIIEQVNGIDTLYGNINVGDIKLYDYIEKDEIIGDTNEKLYLVFQKDGKYLDYKEYI